MFAREASENEQLKQSLERFAILKANAESETDGGQELAERFVVSGYPSFVVVNADGETLRRWWGYDGAEDFIRRLAAVEADPSTIEQIRARVDDSSAVEDAVALAEFHTTRRESADAARYWALAVERSGPDQGFEDELFDARLAAMKAGEGDLGGVVQAAEAAFANPRVTGAERLRVAGDLLRATSDGDVGPAVALLDRALGETEGTTDATELRLRTLRQVDRALLVDHDPEAALVFKRESLGDGWRDDADKLNDFAWWCFEHEVNLEEAETLARRGAELAEDGKERAMILDTVAEIANLRGDREAAVEAMRRAVEADPDRPYYREQLQRFENPAETSG